MTSSNAVIKDAVKLAYKGLFIGDAAAMPVHWYYDITKIKEDFNGWITQYEKPKDAHPSNFMSLPKPVETDDGGPPVQLIGEIILHGKRHLYESAEKNPHIHQGLDAGDNTLNGQCALLLMRTLKECGSSASTDHVAKTFFSDYVKFMTTPGSQNDSYSEGFHRAFFGDWLKAKRPTDPDAVIQFASERAQRLLAGKDDGVPAYIGGFYIPSATILHNISKPLDDVKEAAKAIYGRTHPVEGIKASLNSYIEILYSVVRGGSLKDEAEKALLKFLGSAGQERLQALDKTVKDASDKLSAMQEVANGFGLSCPVEKSFPIVLFLARHFHDDFEGGILCNVNVGGENCHRGAPLGALLGASAGATGKGIPSKWIGGLKLNSTIDELLAN